MTTVTISITGSGSDDTITSSPSNAEGVAEASWSTSAPKRKGNGGTAPGSYTATTSDVTADGFTWDGAATDVSFTLN